MVTDAPAPTAADLARLLDAIGDFVWIADVEGSGEIVVRFQSAAVERITGRTAAWFSEASENWSIAVHPEDRDAALASLLDLAAGKTDTMERSFRIYRPDGTLRWIHDRATAVALPDGRRRLHGIATDVTDRRGLEERLRESEAGIAERAAELERSNRDLERFAYSASHDLQEPLRVVRGYLQLIEKRHLGSLDEKGRSFVLASLRATERMQTLIDDLLQYSRVGTRGHPFERVDANAAFEDAVQALQVAIEETGAVVESAPLPVVHGDRVQISQVFQNLIANALKFHGEGPPHVRVAASRERGSWRFDVVDDGIGIDPKDRDRLFTIFQRLHGEAYPGTGIGLALCRRIVERHGGSIWVDSQPGRGSEFHFTIPEAR